MNIQGVENIPSSGRFILIANHPYGFLDGLALFKMIIPIYPKARIRTFLTPIEFLKIKNKSIKVHVGQHLFKDLEISSVDPQLVYNDFVHKIRLEQHLQS